MTIQRNQVIITALVAMIAIAGYLNYMDTSDKTSEEGSLALTQDGEITALVMDPATGQEMAVITNTGADPNALDTNVNPQLVEGDIGIALSSEDGIQAEDSVETSGTGNSSNTTESGTALFVNSTSDSSFFVQAKLDREQARSSQKSSLTEIINNSNVDKSEKAQSAQVLLELQTRIEKETAAEALIESKGFDEVYVRIGDDSVDVVVNKPELSDVEIAQIEDIVKRKTGFAENQIYINPLNKNK